MKSQRRLRARGRDEDVATTGGALVIVSFAHFTLDQVTQGLETD
jgi:hypothetical protein